MPCKRILTSIKVQQENIFKTSSVIHYNTLISDWHSWAKLLTYTFCEGIIVLIWRWFTSGLSFYTNKDLFSFPRDVFLPSSFFLEGFFNDSEIFLIDPELCSPSPPVLLILQWCFLVMCFIAARILTDQAG